MRVLSPDTCGATRRHQRIHACAECHGARVLKRPQGTRALQYCDEHPLALRTECSTTPKWRSLIPLTLYMNILCPYILCPSMCPYIYEYPVPVHPVPKFRSCHKAIMVITGRAHCYMFYCYIYIVDPGKVV